jgi:hypothetical protein
MNRIIANALPHLIAIVVFIVVTLAYFNPVLSGKVLQQSDIMQWKGMSKETRDYREKTGSEALWTNSQFSGMPAYQIDMQTKGDFLNVARGTLMDILPRPAGIILCTMLGFYLLLIIMGANPFIAAGGALSYTFATYNFLILDAGHVTKMMAIATIAPVVAGVWLLYKGKYWTGAALTGLFLAWNIASNHFQITYYLFICLALFVIAKLVDALRHAQIADFAKSTALFALVSLLAVGTEATRFWTTYEYSKETIRGGSELANADESDGLNKDYALAWSYGKAETMTLMVPRAAGGASGEPISKDSPLYKFMKQAGVSPAQAPTYWGAQPFTGGPIYHGAIVCFLFILGCVVVRGWLKWWLIAATILSIVLAWGKNFFLTDVFFAAFPMYNKFRVVAMILTIAQFTMPLLGFLALRDIAQQVQGDATTQAKLKRQLLTATGITFALLLVLFLVSNGFDFSAAGDKNYPEQFVQLLEAERASMFQSDLLRTLLLIVPVVGLLRLYIMGKLSDKIAFALIGLLSLADLWQVNQRYLNSSNFVSAKKADDVFAPTEADLQILQDKDPNFRVFNVARNPFNDGITSYYHKSIGGYHGAKLSRYQDLIDQQLSKNNRKVLDMLNTKYIIAQAQEGAAPTAQLNPNALGNAWFVREIMPVNTAKEEMTALDNIEPRQTAVVNSAQFGDYIKTLAANSDSTATIKLNDYQPNHLSYESNSSAEALAVFSEIYYNDHKGWNAYIDGQNVPHIRANYVLRALKIPAGAHKIEFKFEPKAYQNGETISLICSLLVLGVCVGAGFMAYKKENASTT